tara:strand:+ start:5392 stop:6387 length:996 start_codon:yes stop_codon:yes gene_type:complete
MILITGSAGFIGFHLSKKLLDEGHRVVGLDNINDYYDKNLKENRLSILKGYKNFFLYKRDLINQDDLNEVFQKYKFTKVVHLAAQAGVRYSLSHPKAYIDSNIYGFFNVIEMCRKYKIEHLIFASSSSVYGMNEKYPFSEKDPVDHPVSLYGATKRSNELIAHSYSHLYNLKCTGLRFFTVYGPWGRPDMALFLFTKAILNKEKINVYNNGEMRRDFTYISDIVNGIILILNSSKNYDVKNDLNPSLSKAPFRIFNIGKNTPVKLMDFISEIEKQLNMKAKINFMPLQPGDVIKSHANVEELINEFEYEPQISVEYGIEKFISWYKEYYKN